MIKNKWEDVDGRALAAKDTVEIVSADSGQRIGLKALITELCSDGFIDLQWNVHPYGGHNTWRVSSKYVRFVMRGAKRDEDGGTVHGRRTPEVRPADGQGDRSDHDRGGDHVADRAARRIEVLEDALGLAIEGLPFHMRRTHARLTRILKGAESAVDVNERLAAISTIDTQTGKRSDRSYRSAPSTALTSTLLSAMTAGEPATLDALLDELRGMQKHHALCAYEDGIRSRPGSNLRTHPEWEICRARGQRDELFAKKLGELILKFGGVLPPYVCKGCTGAGIHSCDHTCDQCDAGHASYLCPRKPFDPDQA